MIKIKVNDNKGNFIKYLNLREEKERYRKMFKFPPTDHGIIQLLDYLSSNQTFELAEVGNNK